MAGPTEFTTLRCDCGNETFTKLVRLKFREGGGTIEEPAGHFCVQCNALVDPAYLARLVEITRKRRQRDELNAELAAAETVTKPAEPKKPEPART